jgi:two-component system response regulator BaeR
MSKHILIVEDEKKIASLLEDYFRASQFQTSTIHEGAQVVEWCKHNEPDLILLDLMLPGKDGIDICREIRQFSNVPIIMITARVDEIDRILGLEIGADDYICKPFSPREVVARVKALFRRLESMNHNEQEHTTALQFDEEKYSATYKQYPLDLTPIEFRLLSILYKNQGKVFSRDQLMNALYNDHRIVTDRTIDSHIKNLRQKLHRSGCTDEMIYSVYGIGYKLELY